MNVLYESDELLVLHNVGDPAHGSVVHFSGALINQGQSPPWAESIFSKWRGDTILISPRNKGYFSPISIQPLLARLPVLQKPVVVMGSSMGGYGALKYSGCLDADAVLAFSPQYAVSPHEAPFDRGRHAFYNAELHGDMAIKKLDVSGAISVFYDPCIALDSLHALAIHAAVDTANLVPARYSGHDLFRIFSNQSSLTAAVNNTLSETKKSQQTYIRTIKKKSTNYYVNLAETLVRKKKTSIAFEVIESAFLKFGKNRPLVFSKARVLQSLDETQAAYEAFSEGMDMNAYTPEHSDLAFGGRLAAALGLESEAVSLLRMSVEKNPFRPEHHIVYIDELLKQGQIEDGLTAITAALLRFPDNPSLLKRMDSASEISGLDKIPGGFLKKLICRSK